MHDIYWLPQTIPKSEPPHKWSYTSLSVFRLCPRRWHLSSAKFRQIGGGTFPARPNPAQVTGNVIHLLLQHFEEFLYKRHRSIIVSDASDIQEALQGFETRSRARSLLKKRIKPEIEENPRCNARQLLSNISLDDCVQGFKKILEYRYPNGLKNYKSITREANSHSQHESRRMGAEIKIEVDDPPLTGRVDAIKGNSIFEYKTGIFSEDHVRQIEFYALLYWYKFNAYPGNIEIHYSSNHPPIVFNDINVEKIRELDGQLRSSLKEIHQTIQSGEFKAHPSEENCRYCDVRSLCNEYWSSAETLPLRFEGFMKAAAESEAKTSRNFLDIEISNFPARWGCGKPLAGKVELDDMESIDLCFGRSFCPSVDAPKPTKARILSAVVRRQGKDITIGSTANTEIFWKV